MSLQQSKQTTSQIIGDAFNRSTIVRIVQIVLIITAVGLIIWDIYLYATKTDTISGVIHDNAIKENLFVLTWIWGVMCAHLFIARSGRFKTVPEPIAILILLLISVLLLLMGHFVPFDGTNDTLPIYMHIIFLVFGAICGYFLWPQKLKT